MSKNTQSNLIEKTKVKIIEFKALRSLHDSGYRNISVKTTSGKSLGNYHDVIHLRLGGVFGPWINIDCKKDGTFRMFLFPSPEGPEFELDSFPFTSTLFIDVIGERLPRKRLPIK